MSLDTNEEAAIEGLSDIIGAGIDAMRANGVCATDALVMLLCDVTAKLAQFDTKALRGLLRAHCEFWDGGDEGEFFDAQDASADAFREVERLALN